jgi:hypothetical protein
VAAHDHGALRVCWMARHGSSLGIGDIWACRNQDRCKQGER